LNDLPDENSKLLGQLISKSFQRRWTDCSEIQNQFPYACACITEEHLVCVMISISDSLRYSLAQKRYESSKCVYFDCNFTYVDLKSKWAWLFIFLFSKSYEFELRAESQPFKNRHYSDPSIQLKIQINENEKEDFGYVGLVSGEEFVGSTVNILKSKDGDYILGKMSNDKAMILHEFEILKELQTLHCVNIPKPIMCANEPTLNLQILLETPIGDPICFHHFDKDQLSLL
jgi:hypothetical protein